jgi:dipeptidyl aminopeptidase/acylaminoacyl peptidase
MTVQLIPRRVLFGNPEKAAARISADGSKIAYLAPVDGVLNVWVGDAEGGDAKPVTDDRDRGIRAYFWAHDNRHLVYLQDKGGDENWRAYRVDLTSGEVKDLTPFEGVQALPLARSHRRPSEVLLALNKENPALYDAYLVNLETGSLERVTTNPGFASPFGSPWIADLDLNIAGATRMDAKGGAELVVPDPTSGEGWRVVATFDFEDSLSTSPLAVTEDGSGLYLLTSAGANTGRLVRLDLASGSTEVLAEDALYDVGAVRLEPRTNRPQLIGFIRDRLELVALDPAVAADLEVLADLGPGELHVREADDADQRWVVDLVVDNGSARTYVYDRPSRKATLLFSSRPELDGYELTTMEPFQFTARDGLTIHGYLSFPTGVDRTDLPTVLNVHGGPWGRDLWGLHPEAQWLANRGYLCVQVNFRGSTGYGKSFTNAGDGEWGAKMHDDLLDAVDWAVAQGYSDRSKIAIYGGSYGGYAALVGVTFTPDVFCCGVDIVGPSNLKTLLESTPPYWAGVLEQFRRRVGDPATQEELLWSRSPLSRAGDIQVPLLIAQGANDPRVKQAESEQIVAAMEDKGIPHTYMLFPDEGHGFAKPENRFKFYAAAEAFLADNLGGRAED